MVLSFGHCSMFFFSQKSLLSAKEYSQQSSERADKLQKQLLEITEKHEKSQNDIRVLQDGMHKVTFFLLWNVFLFYIFDISFF